VLDEVIEAIRLLALPIPSERRAAITDVAAFDAVGATEK
jgi:hypothetical protein